MTTPTVCLDFDDTLSAHDGSPLPGMADALDELRSLGARLLVSSARFSPIYGEVNVHRMAKVRGWLGDHGVQVDGVCLFVPRADVYVDDLAYRLEGGWAQAAEDLLDLARPGWRSAFGRRSKERRRISVFLDAIWADGAPADGAVDALRELSKHGVDVAVAAGPSLDLSPDASEAPSLRGLREELKAAGLKIARVDAEKISSSVYANPRGVRHGDDWAQTLSEIKSALGAS